MKTLVARPRAHKLRRECQVIKASKEISKSRPARPPTPTEKNQLLSLKRLSKVVADTGDLDAISNYRPTDATTNPSLVLKSFGNQALRSQLLGEAPDPSHLNNISGRPYSGLADWLTIALGCKILDIIPGRVSTEVDAHLSFDTQATVDKALQICDMYAVLGVDPIERVYIKIASTWEGIRACEILEKQGISCNMTLLFSFAQAAACADANASLVSPFVGRILDWYKKNTGNDYSPEEDPGVLSVKRIYNYYKQHDYRTVVMAASFRNIGEIRELAGCDNITISPALLAELQACSDPLPCALWPGMEADEEPLIKLGATEKERFALLHGHDAMAIEKLAEGIENFANDLLQLEHLLSDIRKE